MPYLECVVTAACRTRLVSLELGNRAQSRPSGPAQGLGSCPSARTAADPAQGRAVALAADIWRPKGLCVGPTKCGAGAGRPRLLIKTSQGGAGGGGKKRKEAALCKETRFNFQAV